MLYCIVATLNGLDHTKELLRCLGRCESVPLRVVVIDNGSTDGTVDWLAGWQTGLQLFCNEQNLGAAAAWNQGIRFAVQNGASAVLFCGNDTAPMPGTVERLHRLAVAGVPFVTGTQVAYEAPEVAVALEDTGPLLAAPDFSFAMFRPQVLIEAVGLFDLELEHRSRTQFLAQNPAQPYPMRMNPWDYGLFDSSYVLGYFEDNDLHLRAQLAGVPCVRDPGALFRHDCSLTIRINPEVGRLNQERTFAANAERFRAKWGGLPHEVGVVGARPGNMTDEQWAQMSGGRPVQEIDRQEAVRQARETYARYGIPI